MISIRLFAFSAFLLIASAHAGNVIFVTVDGIRFEEFFQGVQMPARAGRPFGSETFPALWKDVRDGEAFVYGDREAEGQMWVANPVGMSLPGYRGILSGTYESTCRDNGCPNIDHETIFDALGKRGLKKSDLAAFTSWEGLGRAIESTPGRITRSVAFDDFPASAVLASERAEVAALVARSRADRPEWEGSRKDHYTYAFGLRYLDAVQPRFLYLSFVDSDELAHRDRYEEYITAMLTYDRWISELRARLSKMGDYGDDTSIVVTTDHGRFAGPLWSQHGLGMAGSLRTWAVVIPSARMRREGRVRRREATTYTHLDVRPTLEALLEVAPLPSEAGRSLVEVNDR